MFTAAIFDMDGLLIDSERPIMAAWMAAAQEIGIEISTEQYLAVVGRASPDSKAILSVLLGGLDPFERTLTRVRMLLMAGAGPAFFHLKPGAVALLNCLRERGVPCAVAHHQVARRSCTALKASRSWTASRPLPEETK